MRITCIYNIYKGYYQSKNMEFISNFTLKLICNVLVYGILFQSEIRYKFMIKIFFIIFKYIYVFILGDDINQIIFYRPILNCMNTFTIIIIGD